MCPNIANSLLYNILIRIFNSSKNQYLFNVKALDQKLDIVILPEKCAKTFSALKLLHRFETLYYVCNQTRSELHMFLKLW